MKAELEKLCMEYAANREAVQEAFRFTDSEVYPVCANIFCAHGQKADAEHIKACKKALEAQTGLFSNFRGKIRPILCCMLALEEDPKEKIARVKEHYDLLKKEFKGTDYLALAALLLSGLTDQRQAEEKAGRGKEIFRRMNREHRFLTNDMDSVFSVLMAFSDKTDDVLTQDMEACYQALKPHFSSGDGVQMAAQVLSMGEGEPEEKANRVVELYRALEEAGVTYGKSYELAPLAALSLADVPIPALTEEIQEADAFLKDQKGYGSKKEDLEKRALHAVMIVSNQYAGMLKVNAAVMTHTLNVLISKQTALYISLATDALQIAAALAQKPEEENKEETGDNKDTGAENGGEKNP